MKCQALFSLKKKKSDVVCCVFIVFLGVKPFLINSAGIAKKKKKKFCMENGLIKNVHLTENCLTPKFDFNAEI